MSWSWKTKPRSIIKTVQWFSSFASLEGENWDKKSPAVSRKDGKAVHPIRRTYIYSAHSDEDTWLSSISLKDYLLGQKDEKETEANGRMDKGAYEFFGFGYIKRDGTIAVTEVGNKIVQGTFDDEDYLKQLLKLRVPNYVYNESRIKKEKFVFPMQIVLKAFVEYESLNRSELALIFGCDDTEDIPKTIAAIGRFKDEYAVLKNKNDTGKVKELFCSIYKDAYGKMENKADSYYGYAEAFSRTLIYTGLFSSSGRSIATKIRIAEHSRAKVRMLQEQYDFIHPQLISLDEYMQWFGSSRTIGLPWENPEERKTIIAEKAAILTSRMEEVGTEYQEKARISFADISKIVSDAEAASDVSDLKIFENILSDAIVSHNEEYFIRVLSKTVAERKNILDKFGDILANEDMSALWLEVNTWKSLIAISGEQTVKRNFKIEDDLTPKSFAPGVGNTPDMELYRDGYIIIPEVSLMTGVRQWEHEASSVIDHVLSFIKEYKEKQVLGLFLSSRIHVRTAWQFFILNRESWVGAPVPVIPLTIGQYVDVVDFIYTRERTIDDFKELLERIAKNSAVCDNFEIWEKAIAACIQSWKQEKAA
ncbi:MAG: AlwI family type II restriction endonuclease [Lachnospiraceae bacterium]|nr:AlwI family type II restriction endonuclease [Lachnospiraceae bacterium]